MNSTVATMNRSTSEAPGEVSSSAGITSDVSINNSLVHVLLLVTGSVAAIKIGLLLDQLADEPCEVRIAVTRSATHFINRAQDSVHSIPISSIYTDETEWESWDRVGDSVIHIELQKWADMVLIAPLDANSLAKIANGVCDNLVTCIMRAWEVAAKPVIICPAMNTAMWHHPATAEHLARLEQWYGTGSGVAAVSGPATPTEAQLTANPGVEVEWESLQPPSIPSHMSSNSSSSSHEAVQTLKMFQMVGPVAKQLACGDVGIGGMASVEAIAAEVRQTLMGIVSRRRGA